MTNIDKDRYNDSIFFHINRELKDELKQLAKEKNSKIYLEAEEAIKYHIKHNRDISDPSGLTKSKKIVDIYTIA